MQVSFDIVKKIEINNSFRTKKVMEDFDYNQSSVITSLIGTIVTPKRWNIGCIVGASGTGKSSIAREKFKKYYINEFQYDSRSVLDNMNEDCTVKEITEMFYKVGFGSVPEWFKPYSVLSTGEKMRVDIARALLQNDKIVFDEFTSTVDRTVAKNICISLNKMLAKTGKQFIAVTCHKDIIEYLQPDWVFDTDTMQMSFLKSPAQKENFISENVQKTSGASLGVIII